MKMKLAIGIYLSASLLFNISFAETPSTEKASAVAPALETTASTEKAPAVASVLETAIANYMNAWQAQDLKTMRGYESWEGGQELGDVEYIQSFDAHFRLSNWKAIKTANVGNDEYKVWMLMDHSLPKQIAGFLPPGKTVRSTRYQWWKKQGDKFVHLFHIERKRLMELLVPKQPPQASTPMPLS